MSKNTFFCKNVLLYTINNNSRVLEIIISKLSCILKMMFRNTFPEPQPDSASYPEVTQELLQYIQITQEALSAINLDGPNTKNKIFSGFVI